MRPWASNLLRLATGAALTGFVMLPMAADAWWNDDWSLRKRITIDTSAAGAAITDPIGTTPVLVRLYVGNFKFEAAKEDGSDLRFVAGDDKTPLKYHLEKYDGLLGEGFAWVNLPDLKPGAQTTIWLYYGNKKANPADDPKGTYDADTVLVYHFAEHGIPARDSSAWANNAQSAGPTADGAVIGAGLRLDGQPSVTLPASPSLVWTDGTAMTWSAWLDMAAPQPNAVIYSRRDGANGFVIGVDNGIPFVEVTTAAGVQRSGGGTPISANGWHHLAVVAAQEITVYLDGTPYASLSTGLPAMATAAQIGGEIAAAPAATPDASPAPTGAVEPATSALGFGGALDELEIAKTARPAGFIRAAAIGQGGELAGRFLSFGADEETASWLSGYFAVILRSVTLDGWVIIGLLAIMAVVSWIVMIDRASYVGRLSRANARFRDNFRKVAADLTILDRGDIASMGGRVSVADQRIIRDSSLYRIYHIGAEEIGRRFAGTPDGYQKVLSAHSIAAIRAGLDGGLVREMQRLNRLMVVLTLAISGGPFIGLLGTVVGVMITFAAIAASGDVNVNAIAPGIAAALVATVAGLAVAIPALFGYNYLISRIRDATSDMQVFVDEFVTRMAEFYHGDNDRQHPMAAE